MTDNDSLHIDPPQFPAADLSGDLGPRLLNLLAVAVRRALPSADTFLRTDPARLSGLIEGAFSYPDYFAGNLVYGLPVLARFADGATLARTGLSKEQLIPLALDTLRVWIRAIEATPTLPRWDVINVGRILHDLGMGLWLLQEATDEDLQRRAAGILAREADRFLSETPRHALVCKSWAEVNAWTGGGIAVVSNLLRRHPHRAQWEQKAREYMISGFATEADAASDRVVDGRPLREWLRGANAFPDHVVENHGFIHPDYLQTFSEMVRAAVAYRLAGESLPEALTFNAEPCFDRLAFLSLPDTTHLYVQGTDYTSGRMDSLIQACGLATLRPTPLRAALLRRTVAALEIMALRPPELSLSGWPGFPHNLGIFWGSIQNYLLCRFYGDGGTPLPDDRIEAALAGTHVSEGGCFAVKRTARAVSTFSWHARAKRPLAMGLAMPLDRDVIIDPLQHCLVGDLRHADEAGREQAPAPLLLDHRVESDAEGFGVALVLSHCGGLVAQTCAFFALPDGRSVYFDERTALGPVTIARSTFANLAIHDDRHRPFQKGPRRYTGAMGPLDPVPAASVITSWLSIDERLGLVTLGANRLTLAHRAGKPAIFHEPDETMSDTVRLAFTDGSLTAGPRRFGAGERIGRFALILCPHYTAVETATLAEAMERTGGIRGNQDVLELLVAPHAIRVRFALQPNTARVLSLAWSPRF